MRKWIVAVAVLTLTLVSFVPARGYNEDGASIRLAQTIYTLAGKESYETKLAIGTVVMNRVADPWFSSTVCDVLDEQQQFPRGQRYDDESLKAANAVLKGKRTLSASALYYRSEDATEQWAEEPIRTVGGYRFYSSDGNI